MSNRFAVAFALLAAPAAAQDATDTLAALANGTSSSAAIVRQQRTRFERIDQGGPALRSIIAVNPGLVVEARAADEERRAGKMRGPLHGLPVLIKDNIETRELPTTAGSTALKDNRTGRDAPLVARLRAAGALVQGKANLSQWANFRSTRAISGWSSVGGLVRNPHALDRNACGSSSGSAVAVAAGLALAAVGTETNGSITCPASVNGIVGFKPTLGMVSRTHVVPIASSQDTPGPMTLSVRDAALLMDALAGSDAADAATAETDRRRRSFVPALSADALRGKRIGVLRFAAGGHPGTQERFGVALKLLRDAGAELVEITEYRPGKQSPEDAMSEAQGVVLLAEFKDELNAYMMTLPAAVKTRTLADLIAYNKANAAIEMPLFGQELFEEAQATTGKANPAYAKARETAKRLAGPDGIDRLLKDNDVSLLVAPTRNPAWPTDLVNGDPDTGPVGAGGLAAIAGYPHLTVPMGAVNGLPVGLSFIGAAWSDAEVLAAGHAYELRAKARVTPELLPDSRGLPGLAQAVAPAR